MAHNHYDNPEFFTKYSQMDRSVKGLEGAGEWKTLESMLPDFAGKRVLDLGCGFGWHCEYAARHGAKSVIGVDLSENMLRRARAEHWLPQITYECKSMDEVFLPENSLDVVLSSLAFHYLDTLALERVFQMVHRALTPGGEFIFSAEHPVFTSYGSQDWYYDEDGNILHFPVDRYFIEGERTASFLGESITKYHRTLSTYVRLLLETGFDLTGLTEPQPSPELLDTVPGMKEELRRPMMLILKARKRSPPLLHEC